ncbi:MAG TPA: STAS domain-containing protein [Dongiaceae bacterium]|jgi:anti-sigma B factor antagonist|nr:STAS domain-containing protein [Dongiaceae bacterium]
MNKDAFTIRSESKGVVRLSGRLDASQAGKAKAFLEPLSEPLVLDFTDLDYISSAGLSVLMITLKRLESSGHTLRLRNVRDRIRNVFRYAGLDAVFTLE